MRFTFLIVILLGISTIGISQNRKESKLYDLLAQKKFSKLDKKASKILKKDKSNMHANFVLIQFHLCQYADAKSAASKKNTVSRALKRLSKLDKKHPQYSETSEELHQIILENALDSTIKKSINEKYRGWLLTYYNDQVPPFHIAIKIDSPIIIDSLRIGDSLRFAMLSQAQRLEGVRYKYAGTSPSKGFDCSGFTQYVYQQVGIEIPHNAQMQSDLSNKRTSLKDLQPGDLVFFGSWNGDKPRTIHAGIIFNKVGNDITVIHCVSGGVSIEGKDSSWDRYWVDRVLFGISMNQLASAEQ